MRNSTLSLEFQQLLVKFSYFLKKFIFFYKEFKQDVIFELKEREVQLCKEAKKGKVVTFRSHYFKVNGVSM